MIMQVYSGSDIGLMRNSNQDYCMTGIFPDGAAWAVVCDGMGGANGGCTASRVATETIAEKLTESYDTAIYSENLKELIECAVRMSNQRVHDMSLNVPNLQGMGTTVVCAIVKNEVVHIVHAGDSRAYLYENGALRQLTKDHSMVQELVDIGEITEEQARNHPNKNIITRALGTKQRLETDYNSAEFKKDSILIICTDGLSNYVTEDNLLEFVKARRGDKLIETLIEKAKEVGGSDNITVAVIEG